MIDIREWSDEMILGLAQIAEQQGRTNDAAGLRAIVAQRAADREALVAEMDRRSGIGGISHSVRNRTRTRRPSRWRWR